MIKVISIMKFKTVRIILQKHRAHSLLNFIYPAVLKPGIWVYLKEFRGPCPTTERCWKMSVTYMFKEKSLSVLND